MIQDCDYVMDDEGKFYIVRGYWNNEEILVNLVWAPTENGTRFNNITNKNYTKVIDENIVPIKLNKFSKHFDPREKLRRNYSKIKNTIWGNFVDIFIEIGIPLEDIGIIGSYLIGFSVEKDIDFVVYGMENRNKLKENIDKIKSYLNATSITKEHIDYQAKKHGALFSNFNTFDKLLCNKWSSIQIGEGLLSTIRFVYKENEIPEDLFSKNKIGKFEIEGMVANSSGSDFSPRIFEIISGEEKYLVGSYFWIYQSCVKEGMLVRIKGNLREGNVITLENFSHGINVLEQ